MARPVVRHLASLACAALVAVLPAATFGQNGDQKPAEQAKPAEPGKETTGRGDDTAEANRALSGPAARSECVWLGERAVGLMWRDDLDTAFRHLDLYDRFGCPGDHIQISFRCVVRQGNIEQKDQKSTDLFNARVHSCWLNPALPPLPAASAAAEKAGTK